MKQLHILLIAWALLFGIRVGAQHTGTSFTLNQPIVGGQHSYTATDSIKLTNGFRYQPMTSSDKFIAQINPYLIFPPTEGIIGGPGSGDIGVVGTLPGSVSVTELGSAAYTMALQLPPGVAGMAPSLAITYNSMAGNGLLGWGWNLSGSSAISRTGKSIYHDGIVEGIKFDNTDNLNFDGNRLLEIAPNSFVTEIENFSKITVMQNNTFGPVWFEVITKDGRKMQYGNSIESRQVATGRNQVLVWHLNRIEDRMGNYIDYAYFQQDGGIRLRKVSYGGNIKTSQAHIYEVIFHYQTGRQDPITSYIAGSTIKTTGVLTNIEIKHIISGDNVLTYELGYDWNTGIYTRLTTIKAYDKLFNELNANNFVWGAKSENFNFRTSNIEIIGYSTEYTLGDFNGDGKSDVACAYYTSNTGNRLYSHWAVYYGMNNGQFTSKVEMGSLINMPNNEKFAYFSAGDFNGDGMDDLLQVSYYQAAMYKVVQARYRFSTGNSFSNANLLFPQTSFDINDYFQVTDMNGNGIMEVFLVKKMDNTTTWFGAWELNVQSNQLYSLFTNSPAQIGYFYTHDNTELFKMKTGDFNGDGKTDLLVNTNELESTIFCLHPNNGTLFELPSTRFDYPNKYHRIYTGDFNGDGITDILTYAYTNSQITWELYYFNGQDAWISGVCPQLKLIDPEGYSNNHFCMVADYNGDGKDDVLDLYYKYSGTGGEIIGSYFDIYYSRGLSFLPVESQLFEKLVPFRSHIHNYFDFNGDGKVETLLFNSSNMPMKVMSYHNNEKSLSIMTFKNGFGAQTDITYKTLTDPAVYSKGTPLTYPLGVVQPPLYVVSSISQQIKDGMTETNRYTYEALRVHKQGKGLLGFGKRTQTDMLSGIFTTEEKEIYTANQNKFFLPYTRKTSTYKAPNQLLSQVTNTLNHKNYTNNSIRIFPFIQSTFAKEYEYSSLQHLKTSKATFDYDIYGNLTTSIQLLHPLSLDENASQDQFDHQTTIVTQYYNPDLTNWWNNKPLHITTTIRYKTENEIMNREYFTFYEAGHPNFTMLQTKLNYPENNFSDPLSTRTDYSYDVYGNMISQTLSAPNAQPAIASRTLTWAYDAAYQHRFSTYEKNDLNYESTTMYNSIYGFATKHVSPNLHETFLYQHPLGIESKTIMPEGIMQVTVKRWATGHPDCPTEPLAALYYSWTKVSGRTEELVFYHQTGLELRRVSTSFNGQKVFVDKEYDNKGRLFKESLPYFAGDTPVYTTYNYDNIGRLVSVVLPDGTSNTTQYLGNKIIKTNAEGQNNTQMYNAAGWLVESEDHYNNVVKYAYFSDGNLKNTAIMDNPETTVSFQYNSRRQRTLLDDPNYGQTSTIYNAFGEVLSQTNPKGQTETYIYDILGRMTNRTDVTGSTTWIYNNSGSQKGTLASVNMSGYSTSFVYDGLLRLQSETENIQGQTYTSQYTYDGFGRPLTTTYPSGYATKQVYNSYGYTRGVADNQTSQMLYEVNLVNALGQLNESTTGNGYITNKTYFPLTYRLKSVKTEIPGNQIIQDMEYGWTSNGNLNFRKKWISRPQNNSITESFTYDNLNRLVSIYLNGSHLGMHQYDAEGLGNLSYKKTDGQVLFQNAVYGGNNAGPHALTSATTSPGIFPPAQQDIVYNAFDKVTSITEGDKSLQITYGHHRQRIGQQYTAAGSTTTKVYAGACEYITKNGQTTIHTYLSGPEGLFAVVVQEPKGTAYIRYIHTDHLGSWNTISDAGGNRLQETNFDAWGNRRDPNTWRAFASTPPEPLFDRGFTGHEHLYGFNLINMNGRVYDPVVSRMLSPDNFIQAPDFSQSFNRYSYCANNPLKYTDPSGEIAFLAVVGIYAGVNLVADLIRNDFKMNIGEIGVSVGLGAVQGALAATGVGAAATGWSVLGSAVASQINIPIYQSESFNLSVSPSLFAGTNGLRVGASLYGSARLGNTSVGFGYNLGRNFGATDLSGQMEEAKWSSITSWNAGWSDGKQGLSYGASYYGGNYAQSVGNLGFQIGRFNASIENDFWTGSGDKHRTAAITASYQVNDDLALTAGFSIWTGAPNEQSRYTVNGVDRPCYYSDLEGPSALRNGNWFVGANYRGRSYLAGGNGEGVRSRIQNGWHDAMGSKALGWIFGGPSPHFERMNYESRFYSSYGTYNPFTIYRQ